MALLLALLLPAFAEASAGEQVDPADQLRRQELALRLYELMEGRKLDAFSRAVQRELGGASISPPLFNDCWRPVARHCGGDCIDALAAAWDRSAPAPTPGRLLFRARIDEERKKTKEFRERLEDAAKKYPAEPELLWRLGKARFDAGERGPAADAFEASVSQKGAVPDLQEFHKLLVLCYAETGRAAAATEHLRALRDDDSFLVEAARLAAKAKLHGEAARLFRLAVDEYPQTVSLRLNLIASLIASGEPAQAAAERAKLLEEDGRFSPGKLQDYFLLLPAEGRAEEVVRTLRDLARESPSTLLRNVPPESRGAVMAEWEKTVRDGGDWVLLARMKESWTGAEGAKALLDRGEKRFPDDPRIVRERIEILARAHQYPEALAAYARLATLDPDSKRSGPRPFDALQEALADQALKDVPGAMAAALRLLSEPGLSREQAAATRAALKPGWDLSAADFWGQLKKTPFPKPAQAVEEAVKAQIERLGADDFNDRADASQQLRKSGLPALPVLLQRVDDPDAEIRSKVREAIRAILTD